MRVGRVIWNFPDNGSVHAPETGNERSGAKIEVGLAKEQCLRGRRIHAPSQVAGSI